MTKSTVTATSTLATLDKQFKKLQAQRKALKSKFQADLDARFAKYRADVKELRAKKDELWELIKQARKDKTAAKAAAKAEPKAAKLKTKKTKKVVVPEAEAVVEPAPTEAAAAEIVAA